MRSDRWFGVVLAVAAAGAALGPTIACNRPGQPAPDRAPHDASLPVATARPAPTPEARPITLTGCLQEGRAGVYILTRVNEPRHPDSSSPSVVARERLTAAEQSYRLIARTNAVLTKLLGKQVRVEGTLVVASDLVARIHSGEQPSGMVGRHAGTPTASAGLDIHQNDLAKVDVTSVEKVANTCGSSARAVTRHSRRR